MAGWIARLRPSSPESPAEAVAAQQQRRVDRAARDDDRVGLDAQPARRREWPPPPRARGRARRRARARARPGVGDGAGVPGARHVGDADVLLRRGRAAERAHPRADAAARVAVDEVARPAERLGAAPDDVRVVARELGRHLATRSARARRGGRTGRAPRASSASSPNSLAQRSSTGAGVRKQVPEFTSVVPPTALPERQHDRRRCRRVATWPGVAVEPRGHLARPRGHVVGGQPLALLEHHDAHAALGELLGDRRAARAGADHAGVGAHDALAGIRAALDPLDGRDGRRSSVPAPSATRGGLRCAPRAARHRVGVVAQPAASRASSP